MTSAEETMGVGLKSADQLLPLTHSSRLASFSPRDRAEAWLPTFIGACKTLIRLDLGKSRISPRRMEQR